MKRKTHMMVFPTSNIVMELEVKQLRWMEGLLQNSGLPREIRRIKYPSL